MSSPPFLAQPCKPSMVHVCTSSVHDLQPLSSLPCSCLKNQFEYSPFPVQAFLTYNPIQAFPVRSALQPCSSFPRSSLPHLLAPYNIIQAFLLVKIHAFHARSSQPCVSPPCSQLTTLFTPFTFTRLDPLIVSALSSFLSVLDSRPPFTPAIGIFTNPSYWIELHSTFHSCCESVQVLSYNHYWWVCLVSFAWTLLTSMFRSPCSFAWSPLTSMPKSFRMIPINVFHIRFSRIISIYILLHYVL